MSEIRSWSHARKRRIFLWLLLVTVVVCCDILYLDVALRPNPKITLVTGYMAYETDESCKFIVNVTVVNNGAEGWISIRCRISSPGMSQTEFKSRYLARGETQVVQFECYGFKGPYTHPDLCNISSYEAWIVTR